MLPEQSTTTLFSNLRQKIADTDDLPIIPEVAKSLLYMANNSNTHMNDFVDIIETDPSLSAQLIRYASSAYFNSQEDIKSIRYIVCNVLGFRRTLDIALGLSVGRVFKIASDGPLGLQRFWRNAVYSAMYMERLSLHLDDSTRVNTDLAFLCGLMHNFGILVMGHLFPRESMIMNQIIKANPNRPLEQVERQVMNIDHSEAGSILLQRWNLPEEIVACAAHHHSNNYAGPHANYIKLQQITDCMLTRLDISDTHSLEIPRNHCLVLGIEPETAEDVFEWLNPQGATLAQLANVFIA